MKNNDKFKEFFLIMYIMVYPKKNVHSNVHTCLCIRKKYIISTHLHIQQKKLYYRYTLKILYFLNKTKSSPPSFFRESLRLFDS